MLRARFSVSRPITAMVLGLISHVLPSAKAAETDLGVARVREVPAINGGATVEGSIHMMGGGGVNLNGGATITGDLLVPGAPTVRINGNPAYAGTLDGTGAAAPSNYTITLNGGASLRHVVRRTDPLALAPVPTSPAPTGTRSVNVNNAGQSAGDWSTLRNLTLNGNVGQFAVPAGTYGDFTANGGSGFTLGVAGAPANTAPVAIAQTLATPEDTPLAIELGATEAEGDALTYEIVAPPSHGTLAPASGAPLQAPGYLYTPAANFHGTDSFTFRARDGALDSNVATVSITITPVNDEPVAQGQSLSVNEGETLAIALAATDADGDALTYAIVDAPAAGALVLAPGAPTNGPNYLYTPPANRSGVATFTFRASDGAAHSAPATVEIVYLNINDAPLAVAATAETDEDATVEIMLSATDPDGDDLTYAVAVPPAHGVVMLAGNLATYTPAADYHGPDAFTFVASDDGEPALGSAPAVISLTVRPINDAPTAGNLVVETPEDTPLVLTLAGLDADGDELTFEIVTPPEHGTLTGSGGEWSYTPAADSHGADLFTYRVSDGQAVSEPAQVAITVTPVNDAPVAGTASVVARRGTALTVDLPAQDADGDALTASIVVVPAHGVVSLDGLTATYTPAPGYVGPDEFAYVVNDGTVDSMSAAITVVVRELNDPPVVDAGADRLVRFTPRVDGAPTGRIVVNNDEWVITDTGFAQSPFAGAFARNLADFLTGGKPGARFFAYTNTVPDSVHFAYTGTSLAQVMAQAGHTFVKSPVFPATVAEMLQYDAIFLSANLVNNQLLIDYVEAGGSIYLSAGTKWCGCQAEVEAGWWNAFLNHFGLNYTFPYNGVTGTLPISSEHPLLAGIDSLYFGNGNSITLLTDQNGDTEPYAQIVHKRGAHGLLAVYGNQANEVFLRGTVSDDGRPVPPGALTYAWTQIEGVEAEIESPHTLVTRVRFAASGVYRFRLTVSDGELASADEVVVHVNEPPRVDAGEWLMLPSTNVAATLGGSASDDGVSDPLAVSWSKLTGPGVVEFSPPDAPLSSVRVDAPGIYLLQLSANDGLETTTDLTELRVALKTWAAPDDMIAWWPFNRDLADMVTGAYRFSAANPPDFAPARVSRGLRFDADDDDHALPVGASLDLGVLPEGFTVEFWMSAPSLRDGTILSFGASNTAGFSIQQTNSGREIVANLRERTAGANRLIGGGGRRWWPARGRMSR